MRQPATSEQTKPILPCSNWTSPTFSTPCAIKSRRADERSRRLFHALARSFRLSAGTCRSLVCPACPTQHLAWRSRRRAWPFDPRLRRRLFAQTGSSHRDRSLCLHAQSALSRQRCTGARRRHCHAVVGLRIHSSSVLRNFLFHGDAPRRKRTAAAAWRSFRRICPCGPVISSSSAARAIIRRILGGLFL